MNKPNKEKQAVAVASSAQRAEESVSAKTSPKKRVKSEAKETKSPVKSPVTKSKSRKTTAKVVATDTVAKSLSSTTEKLPKRTKSSAVKSVKKIADQLRVLPSRRVWPD